MVYNYHNLDNSNGYALDGEKFETFLELLKELNDKDQDFTIRSWSSMAAALGISQTTIYKWKQSKEAKQIMAKGLSYGLKKMTETGKNDWRMWREYLKMQGMGDIDKVAAVDPDGNPVKKYIVEFVENGDENKGDKRSEEDFGSGNLEQENINS